MSHVKSNRSKVSDVAMTMLLGIVLAFIMASCAMTSPALEDNQRRLSEVDAEIVAAERSGASVEEVTALRMERRKLEDENADLRSKLIQGEVEKGVDYTANLLELTGLGVAAAFFRFGGKLVKTPVIGKAIALIVGPSRSTGEINAIAAEVHGNAKKVADAEAKVAALEAKLKAAGLVPVG